MTIESMKTFYFTSVLAVFVASCAGITTSNSNFKDIIDVSGSGIQGIILTANYKMPFAKDTLANRFTPSREEIVLAEAIIKQQIKAKNKDEINQNGDYPVIHENLDKYFRQYVGYLGQNNDKIIYVNMLWNRWSLPDRLKGFSDPRDGYKDGFVIVADGGSRYWTVKINLKTRSIVELSVNGIA